ncbi:MAG TPA: DUF6036 family nucleotidyltransferase [Usitatibacter sp.]|nr:DUF6036 family nucleotidyltransferase [Usitatibacter sp.]
MRRTDLEHIIRAAGDIANDNELIIIGSQAILAQYPDAPAELLRSMEADLWPKNHPEKADLVDGSIGEGSTFHETNGYYAQGVGPDTARLPAGWVERLVPIRNANTRNVTGWCLEVHDLALSKFVAGRHKDLEYTRAMGQGCSKRRSYCPASGPWDWPPCSMS